MFDGFVRIVGGPYDGEEVDADEFFGGESPEKLAIGHSGPDWWIADHELDRDADGLYYRFIGLVGQNSKP